MSYLRDKKHNTKKVLFAAALLVFLVYILLFTRVFGILSNSIGFIAVPIWKTQELIVNVWDNTSLVFTSKKSLLTENKQLKEDMAMAEVKLLNRNFLQKENTELKELLGRNVNKKTVFASILTKPNRSLYDTFIIDAGENSGIKKGDEVLYGETIVVGKVADVFKNSSKVLLLSSPGEEIDVTVGDSDIATIAYGRGGGSFELELPRGVDVAVEDTVKIPGTSPYIFGVIKYIKTEPSNPMKKIFFEGPVNIFELKWVEVVVN